VEGANDKPAKRLDHHELVLKKKREKKTNKKKQRKRLLGESIEMFSQIWI